MMGENEYDNKYLIQLMDSKTCILKMHNITLACPRLHFHSHELLVAVIGRRCCFPWFLTSSFVVRICSRFIHDGGGQRVRGQPAEPGAGRPGHLRHRRRQRGGK